MSTRLRSAELVGAQRPRVAKIPRFRSSAGRDVVALAAAAGLVLDPWQRWVLLQALGERPNGTWAAFEVGLLAPRQNGKNAVLEARELAGLFLFGERLVVHTAHEFKTTQEHFLRILQLIEGHDDFRRRLRRVRTSHGEESIELVSGQRLRFIARSKSSGRGLTGDCIVLDEAFALTSTVMGTLLPTLSARPNPQVWYTSSAGDDTADELASIRRRGHAGSPAMAFMEWSAEPDADLDERSAWAQANPGLGYRISEDAVAKEREALKDPEFARERLGIWQRSQREPVIPMGAWTAVQDPRGGPDGRLRFGIAVTPDRTTGAIAASGAGTVELIDHHVGTGWVRDRAVHLARRWEGVVVVDRNGPAASIADEIEGKGITVERLNGPQYARACSRLYDGVMNRAIGVRPNAVLTAAVAGAAKDRVKDQWVWSRTKSVADVTPLEATTLALSVPVSEPEGEDFAFVV